MREYIAKLLPEINAEAHCDIPCGVYDPTPAKIAAKTVVRMVKQLNELAPPDWSDRHASQHYLQSVSRRVTVKDEHAQVVKRELSILWTDFFKLEHLEKTPDLHEKFWKAAKLASKAKQEIDETAANELCAAVDDIAKSFYEAKDAPDKYVAYQKITDTLF
jgi:nickel superoxide dismutase